MVIPSVTWIWKSVRAQIYQAFVLKEILKPSQQTVKITVCNQISNANLGDVNKACLNFKAE